MKVIHLVTLLSLVAFNGFAVDYSTMSIGEMQALRGHIAKEDRAAFHAEMQKRVQSMTQEERQILQENIKQKRKENEDTTSLPMQTRIQMQIQTQQKLQTPLKTHLPNTPVR